VAKKRVVERLSSLASRGSAESALDNIAGRGAAFATYARDVGDRGARYVFDVAKDRANRAKHGVSLVLAEVLFAGPHVSMTDDRLEYDDVREVAFGLVNDRLFVCVYADGEDERRVISPRKANRREVRLYGEHLE
jgi:uncharacterized DUF497 family protein